MTLSTTRIWVAAVLGVVVVIACTIRVLRGKLTIARAAVLSLVWIVAIFVVEFGLDRYFRLFRNYWIAIVALVAALVVGGWLVGLVLTWPLKWIYAKLERGNYDSALRRANRLVRWWPDAATIRYMRGTVLLFAGRPVEAEANLRETIAREWKGGAPKAIALTNLGYALLDQERYAEAAQTFQEANALDPASGASFNGLAEVQLRQDQQPFEALRNVDCAIELKRPAANTDRHMLGYMWANRAWALARLGRSEEALAAIENARAESRPEFGPGFAGVHWRIGIALAAMGHKSQALDHFQQALDADPQGNYGIRAARARRDCQR